MSALLNQGIDLMLVGMGVVFAFLVMLVAITSVMSRLVGRFLPEPMAAQPAAVPASEPAVSALTLQAIEEAIRQHRASRSAGSST
ncbi:MAG: OadG family transporter subunit [Alcanivoracaceae bacterium]|jgi:oxaloacetate decarboxylase gamma subunit|nr:OadG family transporter subunit [Alcanivoracaceae bacterium]